MLQSSDLDTPIPSASDEPVETVEGDAASGLILLCDHARASMPAEYDGLGLRATDLGRHIAYDIGARSVTLEIARRLGVPAVLARFSRLLIDPNRGEDDPTLVMRIADGSIVPGNARIGPDEIAERIRRFHAPYHAAIDAAIDRSIGAGVPPALLAIHSFTPRFRNVERPWHVAVLWDRDPRLPIPLIKALEAEGGLVVGENVPYTGRLRGDTLFRHGTERGLAHALIEIRQDLIAQAEGQACWAERLSRILDDVRELQALNEIKAYGSLTSP